MSVDNGPGDGKKPPTVKKLKPVKTKAPAGDKPGDDGPSRKKKPPHNTAHEGFCWVSAMSFEAQTTATLLREVLDGLSLDFKREKSERSYSQLYAIVPFPRVAYVFRFIIRTPQELVIDLYNTFPATSGALSFIEIPEVTDGNIFTTRRILKALSTRLPRPPWKFSPAQRIQHGLLNPDILMAKKNWQAIGVAD